MRIGRQSKRLLELIALLGFEMFDALLTRRSIYRAAGCSSERSCYKTTKLLDQNGWISLRDPGADDTWVADLTEQGRAVLTDGLDPETCWKRDWDETWRLLSFDLPQGASNSRQALRKWLLANRFGRLQGSVWITFRDLGDWSATLSKLAVKPEEIVYISGAFGGANSNSAYVRRAWDFDYINDLYNRHAAFLKARSPDSVSPDDFPQWFQTESDLWDQAFQADPFLPRSLWPKEFTTKYRGPESLRLRSQAYQAWKALLTR